MLDAFGRHLGMSLTELAAYYEPARTILSSPPRSDLRYGAVIGAGSNRLRRRAAAIRLYGFADCKVKVGAAGDDDVARLATIRRWLGPKTDLRIDVNAAWHAEQLPTRLAALQRFAIRCLEQPVPHDEVPALAEVRREISVPVMLDESLTGEADARAASAGRTCDLFNIRLSKCGGFLASLRLAALAGDAGLGYQLGCHPGESGILSAAGRHWASAVADVRYVEGSYERRIFRRLLTREDLTFGYGGRAPSLTRSGLGIAVDLRAVEAAAVSRKVLPVIERTP
jgi:muconate cycloisomerase